MSRLLALLLAATLLTAAGPARATQCKGNKVWCKTLKSCTYADACPKPKPKPRPPPRPRKVTPTCPADMVEIPAGTFVMGADDPNADPDEAPKHPQETAAYCIDTTEVTVSAYLRQGGQLHCPGQIQTPLSPVACVTWAEAAAHCHSLDRRLPTEVEWERAARGDVGGTYPWGEAPPSCETAVIDAEGAGCRLAQDVGSRPTGKSPHGALDMVGNVAEWVADWYAPDALRSVRGGSWATRDVGLRPSDRDAERPDLRDVTLGFRCAR